MRKGPEVVTYSWSFVTQIFHNGQPNHGGDRKAFKVMTSTLPRGTLRSVASLLAATLYQVQNWLCYMHINFYFYQTLTAFNMLTMMHMASVLLRTKLIVCHAQLNF
jgi:hypothetical protein